MARIVKNPEIRRTEIIDIAEELFLRSGYNETAVSDIVQKVGVSQGTFYYYFKSKEEILDAIIERYIDDIKVGVKAIAAKDDINAIEKIMAFIGFLNNMDLGKEKLIDYFHEDQNVHLHAKFEKNVPSNIIPPFCQMIEEGVQEHLFDTKNPEMAALSIIGTTFAISHWMYDKEDRAGSTKKIMAAIFDLVERILGAKPGIFMEYAMKMEEAK
jgi:AcrR family transcriptional regulator